MTTCANDSSKLIYAGYIESAITQEQEIAEDTFLLIDVALKDGSEQPSEELLECMKMPSSLLGIEKYFSTTLEHEVVLTDDIYSFENKYLIGYLFEAVLGKSVLLHLRVCEEDLIRIKKELAVVAEYEARPEIAFMRWQKADKRHILELMLRTSELSEFTLRLYEDGSGAIIHVSKDLFTINYFELEPVNTELILNEAYRKIDKIVLRPVEVHEDDRFFGCPVHLRYNIEKIYPDAGKLLKWHQRYESTDYAIHIKELPLAQQLCSLSEIQALWPTP